MKPDIHKTYLFLVLVLLASFPFYALNIVTISLPFGLPPSVAMIIVPLLVAAVFVWRSGGSRSLKAWFSSIIDMKRIKDKKWLLFAIAFIPHSVFSCLWHWAINWSRCRRCNSELAGNATHCGRVLDRCDL